jgi:hypothetical protein
LAGFARSNLVSGPVLDGETPVCAALSLLEKFRFPAAFEFPTGDWFESYEPSSLHVSETKIFVLLIAVHLMRGGANMILQGRMERLPELPCTRLGVEARTSSNTPLAARGCRPR